MGISLETPAENVSEMASGAGFMLSYLSRLIRLVDEAYPGVLENVVISIPLYEQGIWQNALGAASPSSVNSEETNA
jgi:hypothetical protein